MIVVMDRVRRYIENIEKPTFQIGGKLPPVSDFYKGKKQEKLPTRAEQQLQLLIKETELAKQDKEELNTTGQIKRPRSLHYQKLAPKQQPTVSQDKMSVDERQKANKAMEKVNKEQLGVLERPLIYLANPEKVLGDIGVPGMETSEEDRQKIMLNRYNTYQSNEERIKNTVEMGLGYIPEATVNTGLAMVGMENPTIGKLTNEIFNPLAVNKSLIEDLEQGMRELGDALNPKLMSARNGEDWIKNWYAHPETKIKASGYDIINNKGDFTELDGNTKIEISKYNLDEYTDKNYIDLLKEKGLKSYLPLSIRSNGVSYGVPESIYVKSQPLFGFNKVGRESVKVHELTHLAETNGKMLNIKETDALLEPFGYNTNNVYGTEKTPLEVLGSRDKAYYLTPTEIHARMNEARYQIGLKPDDIFTSEQFDKIQKEKNWFGMGKYIKDKDAFIKLMNNFYTTAPIAGATYLATQENKQQGGKYSENEKKFLEELAQLKLI